MIVPGPAPWNALGKSFFCETRIKLVAAFRKAARSLESIRALTR